MGAVGHDGAPPTATPPSATFAKRMIATPSPQLVTLPSIKPRSGLNNEYVAWNLRLRRLCHQLGIDYQKIDKPPPVYRKTHGHDTKQEEAHRNEFLLELEDSV